MKSILTLGLAASMMVLSGCAAHPVKVHAEHAADVQKDFKTYALVHQPIGWNASTQDAFNRRIHRVMKEKGYELAAKDDAEVYVSFKTLLMAENDKPSATDSSASGVQNMSGATRSGERLRKVVLITLEEAATDQVIWAGWATGSVDSDRVVPSTTDAIVKILERMPSRS
jgi:hypothetical protein